MNDSCESTFDVLKYEIRRRQNIGLTYYGWMSMNRMNSNFASGLKKLRNNGKLCYAYLFSCDDFFALF